MLKAKGMGLFVLILFAVIFISQPVFSAEPADSEQAAPAAAVPDVAVETTEKAPAAEPAKKETEIVEGMPQGDFAMLLIKELGAQQLLPAAATTMDAFKLMEKLGVVPQKGWNEEGTIKKEDICYMIDLASDKCEEATFEEVLAMLKKKLADLLWSLGVHSVSPQTISPGWAY